MKQYVIDAFTDRVFHGNQAAVCVLDNWLSEELMMDISRENNYSETAFTVKEGAKWHHHPLLGRPPGQGRAGGLPSLQAWRHALLPPGRRQNLHGGQSRPVFH